MSKQTGGEESVTRVARWRWDYRSATTASLHWIIRHHRRRLRRRPDYLLLLFTKLQFLTEPSSLLESPSLSPWGSSFLRPQSLQSSLQTDCPPFLWYRRMRRSSLIAAKTSWSWVRRRRSLKSWLMRGLWRRCGRLWMIAFSILAVALGLPKFGVWDSFFRNDFLLICYVICIT